MAVENLVYVAFALAFSGYLMRDELWLRLLMLFSSANYLVYYYYVADRPLWDAITTSSILALVNLAMIVVIIWERTTLTMPQRIAEIYASFKMLTPGQFRRLIKSGDVVTTSASRRLTTEGDPVDSLYFVVHGPVRVEKRGRVAEVDGGIFIGELAYLTGRPASATVEVPAGVTLVKWDIEPLRALSRRRRSLSVALMAQFNADLVNKVSNAHPIGVETV